MTRIVITGCDYQMRELIMNDKFKKYKYEIKE